MGASHAGALQSGGAAVVTGFTTTEQQKLDIYNEIVFQVYLSRIGGELKGVGETTWTDEKNKTPPGRLSDDFSLTEKFTLPAPASRFGTNAEMRWAFEAAELYRKKLSGDTTAYETFRDAAQKGGKSLSRCRHESGARKNAGCGDGRKPRARDFRPQPPLRSQETGSAEGNAMKLKKRPIEGHFHRRRHHRLFRSRSRARPGSLLSPRGSKC